MMVKGALLSGAAEHGGGGEHRRRWTASGGVLALCATFGLDSPVKNPCTDPFQTPSKLGHPSYPNAPKFRSPKLP